MVNIPQHTHTFQLPTTTRQDILDGTDESKVVVAASLGTAAASDATDFANAVQAVPTGGTLGQVLAKISGVDNAVGWQDAGAGDMISAVYDPILDGVIERGSVTDALALNTSNIVFDGGEIVINGESFFDVFVSLDDKALYGTNNNGHRVNLIDAYALRTSSVSTIQYKGIDTASLTVANNGIVLEGITSDSTPFCPAYNDIDNDPVYSGGVVTKDGVAHQLFRHDGMRPYERGRPYSATFPDLMHFMIYGQSPAGGADALPVVSGAIQPYGNVKFARGIQSWYDIYNATTPTARAAANFTLVSHNEVDDGQGRGESYAGGFAAKFKMHNAGNRYAAANLSDSAPHMLFSNASTGGRYLVEISPSGTYGHYATLEDDLTRAKLQATANGYPYGVGGMIFDQGEAEGITHKMSSGGSTLVFADLVSQYETALRTFRDSVETSSVTATGINRPMPMFVVQTLSEWTGTAQMNAANNDPDIFLTTPRYFTPTAINSTLNPLQDPGGRYHGAEVHWTADSMRWIGEQIAKAAIRVLYYGRDWRPLQPIDVFRVSDTEIDIQFYVPVKPIHFETGFMATLAKMGFEVYPGTVDSPGTKCDITNVAISGEDTVKLTLNASTPITAASAAFVRYGMVTYVDVTPAAPTAVGTGTAFPNGRASTTMTFAGDITALFAPLLQEGAFYLKRSGISMTVRSVSIVSGNTVVKGETAENVGTPDTASAYEIHRPSGGGNLCDSDDTLALNSFTDTSYGTRQGMLYPLNNFCVVFAKTIRT